MVSNTFKKTLKYILAEEKPFSLEHRLLLSSLIVGFLMSILGSIINSFIITSTIAIFVPLLISLIILILYYFVRFQQDLKHITLFIAFAGIIGISTIWIFNGGINGSNILPSYVILILSLLVVPQNIKAFVILLFILINIIIAFVQLYKPEIIIAFPTERERWLDYVFTMIYSSFAIFLIISYVHKSYTRERLRAEENERIFKSLSENSQDNISRFDRQHRHLYVNRAKVELTKLSAKQIIGKTYTELDILDNHQTSKLENSIENVFVFCKPVNILLDFTIDDNSIYLDYRLYPELDEQCNVISVLGVSRDITELKQTNAQLSQLNIDKDRFISILAHDIKSPFNAILGFLDLLSSNIHIYDLEKIERQINIINDKAILTNNLLEEILTWGRAHLSKMPFNPQTVGCRPICQNVIKQLEANANHKSIKISIDVDEDLTVYADLDMLNTILRNLISNAIKFTNEGGMVTVSAEQNDLHIFICISDNGVGINNDELVRLFDISQIQSTVGTFNESGTGLGLLICKEFVEKHSGKIWAESIIGKGSEFKCSFPILL